MNQKNNMELNKQQIEYLNSLIEVYEDHPEKGISFKDLSLIYTDPSAVQMIQEYFYVNLRHLDPDCIIGCDARGFIVGTLISQVMRLPFVMARKPGKLPPCELIKQEYELEYGKSELQMHKHIVTKYKSPVIADDVLATAGTCVAVTKILKKVGINVCAFAFIGDITACKGRERIIKETGNETIFSILEL
jgi:adenine phosphoribosyltransferase